MTELDLKSILFPKKVLEFGNIKIHLEGCDTQQEHYIESVLTRYYPTQEEKDQALALYVQRLICSVIKDVEGVKVNGVKWTPQFIDSTKKEIDLASYVVINRLLTQLSKKIDFSTEIVNFYTNLKSSIPDGIEFDIEDDKKKD
jgi:hypothetical protein